MLLAELVSVSEAVRATSSRLEKRALLAGLLRGIDAEEATVAVSYLTGRPTQERMGVGYATVYGSSAPAATVATLELLTVDATLEELAAQSGPGSVGRRKTILDDLLGRATPAEQGFLRDLLTRNLRQGALEGVMAEAAADALGVPADRVRRAAMLEGDLVAVTARAVAEGEAALAGATLSVFTPVQPMLAKTADSTAAAVEAMGESVVERKLDGLRIQVHKHGSDVRVFSRNLRDITAEVPDVVMSAGALPVSEAILDGEALMIDEDGSPLSFQDSMSGPAGGGGLTGFYFDILLAGDSEMIDLPLLQRRQKLAELVPSGSRVEGVLTSDPNLAEEFFANAIGAGFEGVVVKDPGQPYAAGRRGTGWLKVKPTHTLDLVVLAAEWGSGRRQGWLSNLHLGARDHGGGFVMLGKTFKGLTDEMLEWQTGHFLAIAERRDRRVVQLRPETVYEIAFDGVQRSNRYPGGVALRFARVRRHRPDKTPLEADTIDTVRSFLR